MQTEGHDDRLTVSNQTLPYPERFSPIRALLEGGDNFRLSDPPRYFAFAKSIPPERVRPLVPRALPITHAIRISQRM